ncbi:hypothetical protein [Vreelandella aquamarina]|uniref:Uncharacterized protein n=1 Tax=Vreelandella aquamarina TaxID=77097 RepID=A0A857GL61_9GAMM|nr:hypothetical protein [Halomonas meridiana]QHD50013.1 hypothetical protein CTT34_10080 [Halomonas meridiana]
MKTPANLAEMAHEETGQWLDSDLLETWVVRRFNRLEQKIRNLESEHEAKVIQNVQLMRERDAYRNAEETQIALRERVQEERDALAAHVERLATASHRLINELYLGDDEGLLDHSDRMREAIESVKSDPRASLKRRDLLKQAEVLEEEAECMNDIEYAQDRLIERANELRQQSEGHQ